MAFTFAGSDILRCRLVAGTRGPWTFTGRIDTAAAPAGRVAIVLGSTTWTGTVVEARQDGGAYEVRAIGGAAGLGADLPAKAYVGVALRIPLADLASATGETLSSSVAASLLSTRVGHLQRQRGTGAALLEVLTDAFEWTWRTLPDGTLWLGAETWPAATDADAVTLSDTPEALTIAVESASLAPGQTWAGRQIQEVEHAIEGGRLRTVLRFSAPQQARFNDQVKRAVGLRYLRLYPAQVLSVRAADGALELLVEDPVLRGSGIAAVPLWGSPGDKVRVTPGSTVLLGFRNGNPTQPYAIAHPDGTAVAEHTLTATTSIKAIAPQVVLGGEAATPVAIAALVDANFAALTGAVNAAISLLGTHTHEVTVTGLPETAVTESVPSPPTPAPAAGSTAALQVKAL